MITLLIILIWAIGAAVVALVEFVEFVDEPETTTRGKLIAALRVIGSWITIALLWSKYSNDQTPED